MTKMLTHYYDCTGPERANMKDDIASALELQIQAGNTDGVWWSPVDGQWVPWQSTPPNYNGPSVKWANQEVADAWTEILSEIARKHNHAVVSRSIVDI